ncbi:MAG: thioredoxin-disulfide reductase [Armatimonadetes bacterium]|nr:thioredoxin-disulfide reductase [Armatimonadota bacterium]
MRDITILGGGPAGLTAAIYTARANLAPLVIEGAAAGGQLTTATIVENYPGFAKGILGPALMKTMRKQAVRVGAEFVSEDATEVEFGRRPFGITVASGQRFESRAVIVATGASAKLLGVPGESRLMGRGVSVCAVCDGFFFRNRDVIVIGGGDSAVEEALYLANLAQTVSLVHRRDELRASKVMAERAAAHPKIAFVWNSVVEEILGGDAVTGVRLRNVKTSEQTEVAADGVFVAIGHVPNTTLFRGQLDLDEAGYIRLRERSLTSVDGVFAAGDVHDPTYRKAITAAGFGCMAAIDVDRWLHTQRI